MISSASNPVSSMACAAKATDARRTSGNCGISSSGVSDRFILYSGKKSLRNVLPEASKMQAKWVGRSAPFSSSSILNSMLQKPATAPTGSPSDLRVSGGRAWNARKI